MAAVVRSVMSFHGPESSRLTRTGTPPAIRTASRLGELPAIRLANASTATLAAYTSTMTNFLSTDLQVASQRWQITWSQHEISIRMQVEGHAVKTLQ